MRLDKTRIPFGAIQVIEDWLHKDINNLHLYPGNIQLLTPFLQDLALGSMLVGGLQWNSLKDSPCLGTKGIPHIFRGSDGGSIFTRAFEASRSTGRGSLASALIFTQYVLQMPIIFFAVYLHRAGTH